MTSKEIVRRVAERRDPPRIAFDVNGIIPSDIIAHSICKLVYPFPMEQEQWGVHPELLDLVPGFRGEVRRDPYGNILGRLNGLTKGECVKGVLKEGWHLLNAYRFPSFDEAHHERMKIENLAAGDQFVIGYLPTAVFSSIRDMRGMSNALMDTVLEPEKVTQLMERVEEFLSAAIDRAAQLGFDAVMFGDDLGMQDALFFSPETFRGLFKSTYAALIQKAHQCGLVFIMHSCGNIAAIIEDLIGIGLDVLQFDQPELYGSEYLARTYGKRISFYCPVDIQKVMVTGDRALIEATARQMVGAFERHAGGAFIFKDYPTWEDIGVKDEWASWAKRAVRRD